MVTLTSGARPATQMESVNEGKQEHGQQTDSRTQAEKETIT